jgi:small-conductance mechanosensitive channel
MQRMKHAWKGLPDKPRRALTLILGVLLIITSALIGWVPGPGGMIPFLLGIAVLATEFVWAERFRDWVLMWLTRSGHYIRRHPIISGFFIATCVVTATVFAYVFYKHIL